MVENTVPPASPSWNEQDRLAAIDAYEILDTPREENYDDIAALAAAMCHTPVAAVNFVAEKRQWFKAEVGLGIRETPLEVSICRHAILQPGIFVVCDAARDLRFRDNPLVTGAPHLRFYAGALLETPTGLPIGTLCVLDYEPRGLSDQDAFALKTLARQVMVQLELRRELKANRASEGRLRAAELSYRRLFEAAQDGVFILDAATGRIRDVNPFLCKLLHFSRAEMMGLTVAELSPFHDMESNQEMLARVQQHGYVRYEDLPLKSSDGRHIDVEFVCNVYQAGNESLIQCNIRDITERKRAAAQIVEQATFLDEAQDAITVRALNGEILFWNKGAERMYGWTRQEALTHNGGELLSTFPEKFAEANSRTISHGEWAGELQHHTKDRRELIVEARWTLIRDEDGQPKSVLAINSDITEKKKIEAQFMRAQRMESIGTLAGGIAHDLNNILSPILMSIDLLKQQAQSPDTNQLLQIIKASAQRGADLVRQVLSFARGVEGERIEIQTKHILRELQQIIKDTFPKDIRLQFYVPDDIWTILGDPTQIHQVLLNLCVNARDAMPHGGTLSVTVENKVLDQNYAAMNIQAKAGPYLKISVVDSGVGIPRELVERIFDPFFTTKDIHKGTGLGLSTVMTIVKSHAGFINVHSELGKGTSFEVYLPAMDTPGKEAGKLADEVTMPRGKGETVLVVDDEAAILAITSQTLLSHGYLVLTAVNGADAVAVYAQHQYEIAAVLTDMMMPVMGGAAAIYALKRINPAVKIVAVSGLTSNTSAVKVSAAGVKHLLAKPYTAETLLRVMRMTIDEA